MIELDVPRVPRIKSDENQRSHESLGKRATKVGAKMAGIALGATIGAGIAVNVVPNHVEIGPIEVSIKIVPSNTVELTLVGEDTLKATQPSPHSIFGARMDITNLNTELSSLTTNSVDSSNLAETSAFAQLFTNLDHDKEIAIQEIKKRATVGAIGGTAVASALIFGLPYTHRRRKDSNPKLHDAWETLRENYIKRIELAGIVAGTSVLVIGGSYVVDQETQSISPNPIFKGVSSLEQTQISGSLAPLITSSTERISKIVASNTEFYDEIQNNLDKEFTAEYKAQLPSGESIVPILLVSDRHCNVGMDPVLADTAKLFNTQLAITAGDDNFSGTYPFEFACTSGFASYLKSLGIPVAGVTGNHDSSSTSDPKQDYNTENWEKSQGIKVLTGDIIEINLANNKTMRLLGSAEIRRSRIGSGILPASEVDQANIVTAQGIKLGKVACSSKNSVDIVVAHDPRAAEAAINNGCNNISFAFSGHTHIVQPPIAAGFNNEGQPIYRFVEGTSGGAKENTYTFGPLKDPATSTILYWDTSTNRPVGSVSITAYPNRNVKLGDYAPLQSPAKYKTKISRNNILAKNNP